MSSWKALRSWLDYCNLIVVENDRWRESKEYESQQIWQSNQLQQKCILSFNPTQTSLAIIFLCTDCLLLLFKWDFPFVNGEYKE